MSEAYDGLKLNPAFKAYVEQLKKRKTTPTTSCAEGKKTEAKSARMEAGGDSPSSSSELDLQM